MKKLIIPVVVCFMSLTMISVSFGGLFGGKSIEGEIQAISANTLTIKEDLPADQAADQAAEALSVEVNQDTEFELVDSLAGLSQGDRVKVEYEENDNRNLATQVSKIEPGAQSPDAQIPDAVDSGAQDAVPQDAATQDAAPQGGYNM